MFDRFEALIGKEKLELIRSKRVLIIGTGGVGGYVSEGLIRSGIENITLIDKDVIELTNLNRQIIALHSSLGKYKVDVLKRRLEDINPQVKVNAIRENLEERAIENLDLDSYDYVVDAVDDIKVKIALAKYALHNNIKLIVSTGTARKMKPELLKMTRLDKTSYDPLAKKMRMLLRGEQINKLIVLASEESPIDIKGETLGSSAFVPSVGGLMIANYIIRDIIE